jgi:hypothetical protein
MRRMHEGKQLLEWPILLFGRMEHGISLLKNVNACWVQVLLLIIAGPSLAGCSGVSSDGANAGDRSPSCPITRPNMDGPNGASEVNHGNTSLGVALWWPDGKILAGPGPDGSVAATIEADGSISAKVGWWRVRSGKLKVIGRRLDAGGGTLRADVPEGYGAIGFQPSELNFSKAGCWEITGTVSKDSETFVVIVEKRRDRAT